MRKFRIILQTLLVTLLVLYMAIVFALDNSRVQGIIAQKVSSQLQEIVGARVEIGSISVGLFNAVELHDVTIYDQQQSPMLESNIIYGKVSILPLLNGHIFLRNISILDGNIHLYKQSKESPINCQFILDLFKVDKDKRKPIHLTINSLLMRRCTLAYDEYYHPSTPDGHFSPHHIHLDQINANLSLKELTDDALNVRVRQLSFKEQSGFQLDEMRLHLVADRTHCTLNDLVLAFPSSHIRQKAIDVHYDLKYKQTFWQNLTLNADMHDILLATDDIVPFMPAVSDLDERIRCAVNVSVRNEQIRLDNLSVANEQNTFALASDVLLGVHPHSMAAKVSNLVCTAEQPLIAKYTQRLAGKNLPAAITALGDISLKADADIFVPSLSNAPNAKGDKAQQLANIYDNAVANIKASLATAVGKVAADASYRRHKVALSLSSPDLNPSQLYQHKSMPTLVDFNSDVECLVDFHSLAQSGKTILNMQQAKADIDLKSIVTSEVSLHDITAKATYKQGNAAVTLVANDPILEARADIRASLDAEHALAVLPHDIALDIDTKRLHPGKLKLTRKYGNGEFAFRLQAEAQDLTIDHLQANVNVTDLTLSGDNANVIPYHLRHFAATTEPTPKGNHIRVRSDFADLDYSGSIRPDSIKSMLGNFSHYIENGMFVDEAQPNIADLHQHGGNIARSNAERYQFALVVKDMEFINRMLNINASQRGAIQLQATAMQDGSYMTLSAYAPELAFGKFSLSNLSVFAHSNEGAFNMLGKVSKKLKAGELQAEMTAVNKNGKIITDIEWDEIKSHAFYGKVSAASEIFVPTHKGRGDSINHFAINTDFSPSTISLGDSLWNVSKGSIRYKDHRIAINNVGISHDDQRLSINGIYDRSTEDTIVVDLNRLDLDYALAFAHLNVVDFGGHATGKIYVRQLPNGNPWAKAHVLVPDFKFNHADFGQADVTLGWNHENYDINIQGYIEEPGVGYTRVLGYVDPINRDLDLRTESKNTQLAFLNKYTAGIFENISGRATGNCRIYGPFKEIEFSGKETASCQATIPVTGVTYNVSDAMVTVNPDAFVFTGATIRDNFTGMGHVEGTLRHEHLQNMTYDFQLNGRNLRMYEKPRELDMPFFATATGSGNVHITGVPGKMNADIRITTTPGSELTYILDSPDADVSQLLSLRDASTIDEPDEEVVNPTAATVPEVPETEFNLYFEVDVEDQSRLNLITDDKSGDVITVFGNGPIQAIYHNRSGFQMFGTYNIERGTYGLNIPSLAQRKKFDILSGGRVQFSGDPTEAEVNVHAQYVVNSASLADLNIGTGFANNTTRVNCVVDIFGEVANMQFNLDFELPNCSEDEQQMVRHLIASEEDRTRQVLYLLGVGRFYAYNFTSNELGQSQSVLMMNSLLSTTLSSQLNNIISNAVGNNNWSFGTNISTGQLGWNDMEVEGLVSSRLLNNRLLINGNFGYSERQAATTNFVGDFDVQYLITPKGNVSVRAYSETNDRYFTKSTLTTQGVGIQLKRDFTRFLSLFRKPRQKKNNLKK